jgi:hypothetical protein
MRGTLVFNSVLIGLCLRAFLAEAATNIAVDVSYGAVSVAIANSADGDTVVLPAGSMAWASTLNLTNAITLLGAGTNLTTISGNGGTLLNVLLPADKPVRISGISFNNVRGSTQPTLVLNSKLTAFRVDHCRFNFGKRAVNPQGWVYGVVDHCTFVDCDIGVGVTGDDDFAWDRPVQPGSTNCVCIEDNLFIIDDNVPQLPNEQVYHQEATRTIVRYNVFDGSGYTAGDPSFIDAHGNNNYYTGNLNTDFRGTVVMECYSNVFHAHHTFQFVYLRGGTFFVYGNGLVCDQDTPPAFVLTEEEGWQTLVFNPLRTTWPAQDQITNSYFWANSLNGSALSDVALANTNDTVFIQQGRDYWMHPPNATNVYYPYKPLVYPHPLVLAPKTAPTPQGAIPYATANPQSGAAPLTVSFSSAGSFAKRGTALTYLWSFGDGSTATTPNGSHTYLTPGTYSARLTISDGMVTTNSTMRIVVGSP